MDSHGLSEEGRGVYWPYFLVFGLEIMQAVQEVKYLLTPVDVSASRNFFVASPVSF
jgi:hypothetical protein